jgi:hypothetical protein
MPPTAQCGAGTGADGDSGAEKPYRAKARSWWLYDPPNEAAAFAPIEAF